MNKQCDMFLQFSKQGCNSFKCVHVTLHMGSNGFTAARYLHWIAHGGVPAVHSSSLHDTGKLGGHHRKDKDLPHARNLTEGKGGTSVAINWQHEHFIICS